MTNLAPFRAATRLEWRRLTEFDPGRGDDGRLVADATSMPLDTWLTRDTIHTGHHITEGVGIAVADELPNLDATHDTIRAWCRHYLERDDIAFPEDYAAEVARARAERDGGDQ